MPASKSAGFTAEWLAAREPADRRARSEHVTRSVADLFPPDADVKVLDLACGTGANFFYLTGRLPSRQDWLLVDQDAELLAAMTERRRSSAMAAGVRVAVEQRDLATGGDMAGSFEGRSLVTASALLDLVSADWLQALVVGCRRARAAMLFALTYSGRIECTPREEEDALIRDLVNRHQRKDKGFGPALGPTAVDAAEHALTAAGYRVMREPSDWVLTKADSELQRQLIAGWAEAARAISPDRLESIAGWRERRLSHVDAGRSDIVVGHEDIAGIPSF